MFREPYVKGLSRHILVAKATAIFHGSLDNGSAPFMRKTLVAFLESFVAQEESLVTICPECFRRD